MQHAHRIRPHQDGGAHLQQFGRLFKNRRLESELPQRQRRGQAADSTANNCDAHEVVVFDPYQTASNFC